MRVRRFLLLLSMLLAVSLAFAGLNGTGSISAPSADSFLNGTTTITTAFGGYANVTIEYNTTGSYTELNHTVNSSSPYSYQWDTSGVSDGNYNLRVTLTNSTDVSDQDVLHLMNLTIDNALPFVANISVDDETVNTLTTIAVLVHASDANLARVRVQNASSVDLVHTSGDRYEENITAAGLGCGEGTCLLQVIASDKAGNFNTTTYLLYTDDTAPFVRFLHGSVNLSTTSLPLNLTVSDSPLNTTNSPNTSLFVNGTYNQSFIGAGAHNATISLAEGEYRLHLRSIDNASNSNTTANLTVIVDTTKPILGGAVSNASTLNSTKDVLINVTVSDAHLRTVDIRNATVANMTRNGALWQYSGTPANLGCTSDGACILQFIARDWSGNENRSLTLTLTIDGAPPFVVQTSPADGATSDSDTVSLAFTATGASSSTIYINGTANTTVSGSGAKSASISFADGSYAWSVRSVDASGNANETANRTLSVANLAPIITETSPSTAQSSSTTSVTLSATTNEAATCRYSTTDQAFVSMDGNLSGTSTSHTTSVSVTSGTSYTYYVRCEDARGARNTTSATISFSVASASSGGRGGGGGGGLPNSATYETLSSEPSTRILNKNGQFNFKIGTDTETHRIEVTQIRSDGVLFTLRSDPTEIFLKDGESQEVDVNGDGMADVLLKLVDFNAFTAKFDLSAILAQSKPTQAPQEQTDTPQTQEEDEVSSPPAVAEPPSGEQTPAISTRSEHSSPAGWILAIVVIAILGALYWHNKKPKKYKG